MLDFPLTSQSPNRAIINAARALIGTKEIPGARHNPAILDMFSDVGHGWVQDDETPWCAAFVGHVLMLVGLHGTGKLNARSYLSWGVDVPFDQAQPGDIAVYTRGDPNGPYGHVNIVTRMSSTHVYGIGGNQSNTVNEAAYSRDRLLAIRRAPDGLHAADAMLVPIVKMDDASELVAIYQEALSSRGYHLGEIDGIFGKLTRDAVLAYQADQGLHQTGYIDGYTEAALKANRSERTVNYDRSNTTARDLLEKNSRTVRATMLGKLTTFLAGSVGLVNTISASSSEILALTAEAESVVERIKIVGGAGWPVLAVLIVGLVVWRQFQAAENARIDDARTAKNLGR